MLPDSPCIKFQNANESETKSSQLPVADRLVRGGREESQKSRDTPSRAEFEAHYTDCDGFTGVNIWQDSEHCTM